MIVAGSPSGEESAKIDPAAAQLLSRAATVADVKPATDVRDDQWIYVKTAGTQTSPAEGAKDAKFTRQDWQAVDGKHDGLFILNGQKVRNDADPISTTYRELQALPADPGALLKKLYADTGGQGPTHGSAVFEAIGSMLGEASLLPDVEAALYRAAAKVPGTTVVNDAAGRHGIGISFTYTKSDKEPTTWVFDKKTLSYLGSNEVAVLDVGIADARGVTP